MRATLDSAAALLLLAVASSMLSYNSALAEPECEVCELESELATTKKRLFDCEDSLGKVLKEKDGGGGDSYLDRVCQWATSRGSSDGGKDALKKTVKHILEAARLDNAANSGGGAVVDLRFSVSREDLVSLRRFVLNDEGSAERVQDILKSSLSLKRGSDGLYMRLKIWFDEDGGFAICQMLAIAVLSVFFLWRGVAVWKAAVLITVGSVAWTWVHMYKLALSKKQATLSKLGDVPRQCLVEKQGWLHAIQDAIFGGDGRDRKCEAYYEALMVDPFWEVTPLKAIAETASQFVLRPLEVFGGSVGVFFAELLSPLPVAWKIPVLVIGAAVILLLVIMLCGYRIRSLMFSIEPGGGGSTDSGPRNANASLATKLGEALEENRKKRVEQQRRSEPLPYPKDPSTLKWVEPTNTGCD